MDSGNIVNGPIFLTLQSPNMISVIEAELWLHLHIWNLVSLHVFSINRKLCDIWFLAGDICNNHLKSQLQHILSPQFDTMPYLRYLNFTTFGIFSIF